MSDWLAEARARVEAATPGPWCEDDGNVFSRPLTTQRMDAIRARLSGVDVEHPDAGHGSPLGFIASTGQDQANFESDATFIAKAIIARYQELRNAR